MASGERAGDDDGDGLAVVEDVGVLEDADVAVCRLDCGGAWAR